MKLIICIGCGLIYDASYIKRTNPDAYISEGVIPNYRCKSCRSEAFVEKEVSEDYRY